MPVATITINTRDQASNEEYENDDEYDDDDDEPRLAF